MMLFSTEDSLEDIFSIVNHELQRGVLDPTHPFRFFSLATHTDSDIDVRYVVLRNLDDVMNLFFFTDYRSTKVKQFKNKPHVALLFYHPEKRVQVRIKGNIEIHHQNDLSRTFWATVQGDAQKGYNATIPPGEIISDPRTAHNWPAEMDDTFFCLIKVIPIHIEALQIHGLNHIRAVFQKKKDIWKMDWLAP
jgi:pyridoxine/pyridoxamine 5'-phosphate oxidase